MSYVVPLGPFHPAWRGPLRLVLRVEDEQIVDLEYRGGYNERNLAERLRRATLSQALESVRQLCGVDSHAHALAFCLAQEQLLEVEPPARATVLRTSAAELERALAHLEAVAQVVALLGLDHTARALAALRALVVEAQVELCGAGLAADYCVPLGVCEDLSPGGREQVLLALRKVERDLYKQIDQLIDGRGVLRRTVGIGVLSADVARQFGVRGPLLRAAGISADARVNQPYAAYDKAQPRVVTQQRGDVYSRLVVLLLEALESAKLALQLLGDLPGGSHQGKAGEKRAAGSAQATVESARGLLRYSLEAEGARLKSLQIDAPHQLDRLLVRTLLQGALLDDAALIVASVAPCMACAEG